ncbi:MAG TPA: helix-turn-helix domain-containing protein, partial [Nitriliruptorales bacterium]
MSIKVMAHVWELDLPQREKFVLLALADHADDHGRDVFPSVAHLAWKTGYDRRSIQRIIRALEDRGVLEQVAPGGGRHTPARYAIHTAKGVSLPPFEPVDNPEPRASECRPNEVERAASTTERAANRTQKGGTGAARTVLNHQNQPPPARG